MFDIPSENLRGMAANIQVAIGISGNSSDCRPGTPGPGRDSDVTSRDPGRFRVGCGRHLIAYEYYLSGAMKFLWYVL